MVSIERMTLKDMILDERNHTLSDGLAQLPLSGEIRIGIHYYATPETLDEYSENICYGQRLYLSEKEDNDFGIIVRYITGYYYPLVKNKPFDEQKALKFGRIVKYLKVAELYPIAMHLVKLHAQLIEREQKMLYREPSKEEKAAGIEKLSMFSELSAIDFLRDTLKKTEEEVMLTPYNTCLVRFAMAKEQNAFSERLMEVYKNKNK